MWPLISTCVALEIERKSSKRRRIDSAAAIDLATVTGTERGNEIGIEVSDLIVEDTPGLAAQNPTCTRRTAARPLQSANGTIARPAWPRHCCQTIGPPVAMMTVSTGIETEETETEENVSEIEIAID